MVEFTNTHVCTCIRNLFWHYSLFFFEYFIHLRCVCMCNTVKMWCINRKEFAVLIICTRRYEYAGMPHAECHGRK